MTPIKDTKCVIDVESLVDANSRKFDIPNYEPPPYSSIADSSSYPYQLQGREAEKQIYPVATKKQSLIFGIIFVLFIILMLIIFFKIHYDFNREITKSQARFTSFNQNHNNSTSNRSSFNQNRNENEVDHFNSIFDGNSEKDARFRHHHFKTHGYREPRFPSKSMEEYFTGKK